MDFSLSHIWKCSFTWRIMEKWWNCLGYGEAIFFTKPKRKISKFYKVGSLWLWWNSAVNWLWWNGVVKLYVVLSYSMHLRKSELLIMQLLTSI